MLTERNDLPGIGTGYTVRTHTGELLGVICYRGGEREILFYGAAASPHTPDHTLVLTAAEAHDLAVLLHMIPAVTHLGAIPADPAAATAVALPVHAGTGWAGRSLGQLLKAARTGDGARIIGIIRGSDTVAAPSPDLLLAQGDLIIAAGGLVALSSLASAVSGQ